MEQVCGNIREQTRTIQNLKNHCAESLLQALTFTVWGERLCHRIEAIAPNVKVKLSYAVEAQQHTWATAGTLTQTDDPTPLLPAPAVAENPNEPVFIDNTTTNIVPPLDHPLSISHSPSAWSSLIKSNDGTIKGALEFYFLPSGQDLLFFKKIIEACRPYCLLAIEREHQAKKLQKLTDFDALTNVFNRSRMDCLINTLLRQNIGSGMALTIVDIDRLKDVNNAMGHDAGDSVLVEVAERLQGELTHNQYVGRFGSDQFIVLATNQTIQTSMQQAANMLAAINKPVRINGCQFYISASIGVSHCTNNERKSRSELLNQAKAALLCGKEKGGNTYHRFSPAMNVLSHERLAKASELKMAITEKRLRLQYQPQIHSQTGKLYGVEALARWSSHQFGEVPPSSFISLAEETGQIEALGGWVVREACRQMYEWRNEGLEIPVISVNLSPINFQNPDLSAFLESLLIEFNLPGDSLTLEITENTMLKLTPSMLNIIHEIRALGIGLSVDDFGTGYASLANLIDLPLSEIKIDRSFLEASSHKPHQKTLVETVIGIGRSLGLTVVAEGVETLMQYDLLAEYLCPIQQGYFFSRPLDPTGMSQWMISHQQRWSSLAN